MISVILQAVEVLVALATDITSIGFLLFHALGSRIWNRGDRIYNGERPISVVFELLSGMAVLI